MGRVAKSLGRAHVLDQATSLDHCPRPDAPHLAPPPTTPPPHRPPTHPPAHPAPTHPLVSRTRAKDVKDYSMCVSKPKSMQRLICQVFTEAGRC